ncbi:MAG: hypothetical protein ACX931_02570 [Saccharospirillum sp.]
MRQKHRDKGLLRLFIQSCVYRHYPEAFLQPEQISEVDEAALLAELEPVE